MPVNELEPQDLNCYVSQFDEFVTNIQEKEFLTFLGKELNCDLKEAGRYFSYMAAEARFTLLWLKDYDLRNKRVLEVGAGSGLLGAFFRSYGYDFFSLEPEDILFACVGKFFSVEKERCFETSIESLDPNVYGKFDIVFSNNVLEHVENFGTCMEHMHSVLAQDGLMVHNCPNYFVPYEPHYGIPLVPFFPKVTEWLLSLETTQEPCWQSLNFVTLSEVKKCTQHLGSSVKFRPALYDFQFTRLREDPLFRRRHQVLSLFAKLSGVKVVRSVLQLIPASLTTPMIFEVKGRST